MIKSYKISFYDENKNRLGEKWVLGDYLTEKGFIFYGYEKAYLAVINCKAEMIEQ